MITLKERNTHIPLLGGVARSAGVVNKKREEN